MWGCWAEERNWWKDQPPEPGACAVGSRVSETGSLEGYMWLQGMWALGGYRGLETPRSGLT